jgi:hypothetical protein
MDFNFSKEAEKKAKTGKSDKKTETIKPEEDLTAGISEADCRKALNSFGRALAYMVIGGAVVGAAIADDNGMTPLDCVLFKNHFRHAMEELDAVLEAEGPMRALVPYGRI